MKVSASFCRLLYNLLLYVLAAFIVFTVHAQTREAATGTITGRVTIADKPAPGVVVALTRATLGAMEERNFLGRATTDAEGRYKLNNVPAGSFRVLTLTPGFVNPAEGSNSFEQGSAINLREGETVESVNFALERGGVITGKITDADGKPLIEQRIIFMKVEADGRRNSWSPPVDNFMMLMTDDQGIYRVHTLPAGRYIVGAGTRPGSTAGRAAYQQTFYPDTPNEAEAKVLEVTPGSEAKDIDIRLVKDRRRSQTVAVRVVDSESGTPLVGVGIAKMSVQGNRMLGAFDTTTTDAQGIARFDGLAAGNYAVVVANMSAASDYFSDPVQFEVSEGEPETVEIRAQRGAMITGTLTVEGVADPALLKRLNELRLSAYSRPLKPSSMNAPNFGANTKINPDGSFQSRGLAPGSVTFNLSGNRALQGFSLLRVEVENVPQREGVMEVTAGQTINNVRLVLSYGVSVMRGQVAVVGGTLPPGSRLNVSGRRTDAAVTSGKFAQVDARGNFVLEGLSAGEYEVTLNIFTMTTTVNANGSTTVTNSTMPRTLKEKVQVPATGEVPVKFTLDLTPKEGQQ